MSTVTITPDGSIEIPQSVRDRFNLQPGQRLHVFEYGGRIQLIPERDISELKGFVKGINTDFERNYDK